MQNNAPRTYRNNAKPKQTNKNNGGEIWKPILFAVAFTVVLFLFYVLFGKIFES
jgi:hypothetical protein